MPNIKEEHKKYEREWSMLLNDNVIQTDSKNYNKYICVIMDEESDKNSINLKDH